MVFLALLKHTMKIDQSSFLRAAKTGSIFGSKCCHKNECCKHTGIVFERGGNVELYLIPTPRHVAACGRYI